MKQFENYKYCVVWVGNFKQDWYISKAICPMSGDKFYKFDLRNVLDILTSTS